MTELEEPKKLHTRYHEALQAVWSIQRELEFQGWVFRMSSADGGRWEAVKEGRVYHCSTVSRELVIRAVCLDIDEERIGKKMSELESQIFQWLEDNDCYLVGDVTMIRRGKDGKKHYFEGTLDWIRQKVIEMKEGESKYKPHTSS